MRETLASRKNGRSGLSTEPPATLAANTHCQNGQPPNGRPEGISGGMAIAAPVLLVWGLAANLNDREHIRTISRGLLVESNTELPPLAPPIRVVHTREAVSIGAAENPHAVTIAKRTAVYPGDECSKQGPQQKGFHNEAQNGREENRDGSVEQERNRRRPKTGQQVAGGRKQASRADGRANLEAVSGDEVLEAGGCPVRSF